MVTIDSKKALKVASVVCSVAGLAISLAGNVLSEKMQTVKIEEAVKNYMENR